MAAAAYSIPKQPHASELYSCEHENVSVYRSAHILIMDHIRHTHRHTKGSTDMNNDYTIEEQTAVATVAFSRMYEAANLGAINIKDGTAFLMSLYGVTQKQALDIIGDALTRSGV